MRVMRRVLSVVLVIALALMLGGCASTMRAIEHGTLSTNVSMSDSIMLDAQNLAKNRNLYVRVTNTSELQEIAFEHFLIERLAQKGYNLVNDPSNAGYIITANVLHMGHQKDASMTPDGMFLGGWGGALLGAGGKGWRGPLAGAMAIGAVGSVVGGLAGQLIKVGTYLGVVDVQIQEKVGGVVGKVVTDVKQGSSATIHTEKEIRSDYQTYRTRIMASATKTNISREEAAMAISERLAIQIAGVF